MSDLSPVPLTDYGSLQTSFGQGMAAAAANNAAAQRNLADIPLTQQQTQQLAMQNQLTRMQMPIRQAAIQQLMDQSGVDANGNPLPKPQSIMAPPDQHPETVGDTDVDPDVLAQHAYDQFAPLPTAPPPAVMQRAMLYQNAGMPDQAKMVMDQYTAYANNQNTLRSQAADLAYQKMAAVATSKPGAALTTLDRIDPDVANALRQKYATAGPDELDQDARDYATVYAGNAYRFSGREAVKVDDRTYRDKQSGQVVVGAPTVGMSQTEKAELIKGIVTSGNDIITVKQSDGTEAQVPRWRALQYPNQQAYQTATVKSVLTGNGSAPGVYQPPQVVSGTAAAPVAAGVARPQPAAATQGGQVAPAGGAQPQQPQRDNGLLPGVNPLAFPRTQTAPVRQGVSQTPADAENMRQTEAQRQSMLKEASDQVAADQAERALITRAQVEAAHINPSAVGPGSEFWNGVRKLQAAVSSQPPDALVDYGELNKTLLNMGAQNIRAALQGQRITNQEFMTMLSQGNPNTEQPKQTMQRILNYLSTNNDYDTRFNNTRIAALRTGADPYQVNSTIGRVADRSSYIQQRTGVLPAKQGGGGPQQSAAPNEGATTISKSGKQMVYSGGQWRYAQ